jgi:hypothetical protein
MSNQKFDAFINQINQKKDEPKIDWDKTRNDWLTHLHQFYETIKGFLADYEKTGKLSYEFSKKEIFEEYIGSYFVDVMDIKVGEYRVKLEPIGTNLIGAYGRVDLIGVNGKVKFGLVNKDYSSPSSSIKITCSIDDESKSQEPQTGQIDKCEPVWKIATPPPKIQYIDLEKDNFLEALLEVIGG